jgi:predicted Zn-dependent protease
MANEAQLAAIIGHELGHYLARHSIELLRDAKSRAAFGQFLGIILSAGGAGGVALGTLGQLAIVAGLFAYSREQEIQADEIGLELMSGAGYAPQEAPRIWQQLVDEYKGNPEYDATAGSVLFATHPAPSDRLTNLAELAKRMPSTGQIGETGFAKALSPVRFDLLKDEMKRRRPGETLVLLDRLIGITPGDADLLFFRGEAYRMRNQSGDLEKALEAYKYSIDSKRPPPESYRSMGLIQRKIGQSEAARESFGSYLRLRPDAEDSDLIRSYLEEGS